MTFYKLMYVWKVQRIMLDIIVTFIQNRKYYNLKNYVPLPIIMKERKGHSVHEWTTRTSDGGDIWITFFRRLSSIRPCLKLPLPTNATLIALFAMTDNVMSFLKDHSLQVSSAKCMNCHLREWAFPFGLTTFTIRQWNRPKVKHWLSPILP